MGSRSSPSLSGQPDSFLRSAHSRRPPTTAASAVRSFLGSESGTPRRDLALRKGRVPLPYFEVRLPPLLPLLPLLLLTLEAPAPEETTGAELAPTEGADLTTLPELGALRAPAPSPELDLGTAPRAKAREYEEADEPFGTYAA